MKAKFGILISHLLDRGPLLERLEEQLDKQRAGHNCILIINSDSGKNTTGHKRNMLLEKARSEDCSHIAFFDDDDLPGPNYVSLNMEAVKGDYDCASLWGQYYENNKKMNPFHHSIKYDHWFQDKHFYYRNPNHLNCIKLSLLNGIQYKDITIGEDGNFSQDLQKAGVLKNEYPINEVIYHYFAGRQEIKNREWEKLMAGI